MAVPGAPNPCSVGKAAGTGTPGRRARAGAAYPVTETLLLCLSVAACLAFTLGVAG